MSTFSKLIKADCWNQSLWTSGKHTKAILAVEVDVDWRYGGFEVLICLGLGALRSRMHLPRYDGTGQSKVTRVQPHFYLIQVRKMGSESK